MHCLVIFNWKARKPYLWVYPVRAGARDISCVGDILFCRPLLRKGRQNFFKTALKKRKIRQSAAPKKCCPRRPPTPPTPRIGPVSR